VSRARKAQGRRTLLQIALGLPSEISILVVTARAVEGSRRLSSITRALSRNRQHSECAP